MNNTMRSTKNEDKSRYYYADGKTWELVQEPTVYALKMSPGRSTLSTEANELLRARSSPLYFIDHKGMKIYETDTETRQRAVRVLNNEDAVEYATPAFRRSPESSELLFITNEFLVKFKDDISREEIDAINARYGVTIVEELSYAPNAFKMVGPPNQQGTSAIELANTYYEEEPTEWAHPVTIKRQGTKQEIRVHSPTEMESYKAGSETETISREAETGERTIEEEAAAERAGDFFDQQWHLHSAHTRVVDAWNIPGLANWGGDPNIKIAILDDGVDVNHPEFAGKVVAQFDFNTNTADGSPKTSQDKHGTACAGVAVAMGTKAYGAAPFCKLIVARMPMFVGPDDEARMFQWACDQGADVISCSWGPPDNTGTIEPMPDAVAAAIRYCLDRGRGGKGIPIFFAAGNGNELVSTDGYASSPNVIAVAACTSQHQKSPYSDFGPEIWITASSNGSRVNGDLGIFTADRRGADGYNSGSSTMGDAAGDYTNSFGGTSSACPLAAGIAALVLSVNPDLEEKQDASRKQVRALLARTAQKIGSGYDANGHSQIFGYGRVDALAAVEEAIRMKQGGSGSGGGTTQGMTMEPVAASVSRTGAPPQWRVNPSPHPFWAAEFATSTHLFNFANSSQRNDSNFFGTWITTPFPTSSTWPVTYTLPQAVWDRLKSANQIYFRLWGTDLSNGWLNEETTTDDSVADTAPSITITGSGSPSGGGSSGGTVGGTVTFPSGAVFSVVTAPADGVDYSDPVNGGMVPLIEVRGRGEEKLSANFQVKELDASDGARYARISVELVEVLQRLRTRLNKPLIINSGYRHPVLNNSVGGASLSRHLSGQAADVRCSGVSARQLAEIALEEFGCEKGIGIGLGVNSIHIDVRGTLTSWVYEGAEMTEAEFDAFVQQFCSGRGVRSTMDEQIENPPLITGPDVFEPRSPDRISFHCQPGPGRRFQVEVTTDPELFKAGANRTGLPIGSTPDTFFRSETMDPLEEGMTSMVYILPEQPWERLKKASRLYYRMRVSGDDGEYFTTPGDLADQAPYVQAVPPMQPHNTLGGANVSSPDDARRRDEELWREE